MITIKAKVENCSEIEVSKEKVVVELMVEIITVWYVSRDST